MDQIICPLGCRYTSSRPPFDETGRAAGPRPRRRRRRRSPADLAGPDSKPAVDTTWSSDVPESASVMTLPTTRSRGASGAGACGIGGSTAGVSVVSSAACSSSWARRAARSARRRSLQYSGSTDGIGVLRSASQSNAMPGYWVSRARITWSSKGSRPTFTLGGVRNQ
jgi:hypothetical protein